MEQNISGMQLTKKIICAEAIANASVACILHSRQELGGSCFCMGFHDQTKKKTSKGWSMRGVLRLW